MVVHMTKKTKVIIKGITKNTKHILINILNNEPKTSNNINECLSLVLGVSATFSTFSSGSFSSFFLKILCS